MSKPLDTEYFQLLTLECDFIEAGFDLIAARSMAKDDLARRKNVEAQYDSHHEDRGR